MKSTNFVETPTQSNNFNGEKKWLPLNGTISACLVEWNHSVKPQKKIDVKLEESFDRLRLEARGCESFENLVN